MYFKRSLVLFFSFASLAGAFAPPLIAAKTTKIYSTSNKSTPSRSSSSSEEVLMTPAPTSVETTLSQYGDDDEDDDELKWVDKFLATGGGGEVGSRGEVYFFMQALVIVTIVLGGLPFVSLQQIMGLPLGLSGGVLLLLTGLDMGKSLSQWPQPNGEGLVREGLYSQMRHPMYAGVLATLAGFSVWTGSLERLLWTVLLYAALEVKSDYEEEELKKVYPDYEEYRQEVQTKFMPKFLMELRRAKEESN